MSVRLAVLPPGTLLPGVGYVQDLIYGQFHFVLFRPSWRALSGPEQADRLEELEHLLTRHRHVRVDHFLPERSDPHCDFLLRFESDGMDAIRGLSDRIREADFFHHIEIVKTVTGKTRPPGYASEAQLKELERLRPREDVKKHAALFLVSRTSDWWHLPHGERRAMVREHVDKGLGFADRMVRRCYYCEGLDTQQDFIYFVESDRPDAVREAYDELRRLRDANYWARHHLAFEGVPVTLSEWEDRARTTYPNYLPGDEQLRPEIWP